MGVIKSNKVFNKIKGSANIGSILSHTINFMIGLPVVSKDDFSKANIKMYATIVKSIWMV